MSSYESLGLNVIGVRAGDKFLSDLAGTTDPEKKRKIIGRDFIEVFDSEAMKLTDVKWLAQGTIYPRCHRVDIGKRTVGHDQIAPQRRRIARKNESQNRRAASPPFQG